MFDVKRLPLNYFEETVRKIETTEPMTEGKILFYGASLFGRWSRRYAAKHGTPCVEDMILDKNGEQACINHAFGGSTLEEQLYYYPRLVRPYKPKAITLASFGNDFTFSYNIPELMMLFSRFCEYARTDFPGIRIFVKDKGPSALYVPEEPDFVEEQYSKEAYRIPFDEMNNALREYCSRHEDVTLVEYNKFPWFFQEGCTGDLRKVRTELFNEDRVHFAPETYSLLAEEWKKILKDLL